MEIEDNPLANKSYEEIRGLLGTMVDFNDMEFPDPEASNDMLPTSFDSRDKWSNCVHPIRDQKQCGSCWAFGASETLSDRFCIFSDGKVNVVLSPEDMVECDQRDMGCNGGNLNRAWKYLENTGIVTEKCLPYTSGDGSTDRCPSKCESPAIDYEKYKCEKGSIVTARTADAIKSQIYNYGPMETGFTVYSDFMNYASGVYTHQTGHMEGGHAVKIVGWGLENGLEYWLCANSWGPGWGIDGFFKIAFGECGIDQSVYACSPDLSDAPQLIPTFV